MNLIFIHGPAAAGKLTVGRALAELTGFKLFHNHLVVDTLLAVFPFGSEPFARLREEIWLAVFREAAAADVSLIFTFTPEPSVNPGFIGSAVTIVEEAGGQVHFVELTCPIEELERRIENPSRAEFKKLRSLETFREIRKQGGAAFPSLPAGIRIDTSQCKPQASARKIAERFGFIR